LKPEELEAVITKLIEASQTFMDELIESRKLLTSAPSHCPEITFAEEFPEELRKHLRFFDKGDYIRVEPKHYLGNELFAKIVTVIKDLGGEYVSAGRNSHFRVPVRMQRS